MDSGTKEYMIGRLKGYMGRGNIAVPDDASEVRFTDYVEEGRLEVDYSNKIARVRIEGTNGDIMLFEVVSGYSVHAGEEETRQIVERLLSKTDVMEALLTIQKKMNSEDN